LNNHRSKKLFYLKIIRWSIQFKNYTYVLSYYVYTKTKKIMDIVFVFVILLIYIIHCNFEIFTFVNQIFFHKNFFLTSLIVFINNIFISFFFATFNRNFILLKYYTIIFHIIIYNRHNNEGNKKGMF
jgi:hypothetical protein